MKTIIGAALLFLLANYADYELQAYQHGWTGLLDLTYRAGHWGVFDFIPHDPWHIAQWIRNFCMILGSGLAWWWGIMAVLRIEHDVRGLHFFASWDTMSRRWYGGAATAIGLYVATRGIGFSLLRALLN